MNNALLPTCTGELNDHCPICDQGDPRCRANDILSMKATTRRPSGKRAAVKNPEGIGSVRYYLINGKFGPVWKKDSKEVNTPHLPTFLSLAKMKEMGGWFI
ncbi:MAG: hypothetical protein ACO33F_08010 [Ilumatobacteraceae bacterium]|jgi:hypothetical protein